MLRKSEFRKIYELKVWRELPRGPLESLIGFASEEQGWGVERVSQATFAVH